MQKLVCVALLLALFAPLACNRNDHPQAPPPATDNAELERQFEELGVKNAALKKAYDQRIAAAAARQFPQRPDLAIDPNHRYIATIHTAKGDIVLELDAKHAPQTVNSFVFLTRHHFFDGVTFHRVVPGELIQGGDPRGDGSGGPGYTVPDEIIDNPNQFQPGSLAMANAGPNTAGSQFFICLKLSDFALQHWPGSFTIFGSVTQGLDVAKKIVKDDVMQTVTIEEIPSTQAASTEPATVP